MQASAAALNPSRPSQRAVRTVWALVGVVGLGATVASGPAHAVPSDPELAAIQPAVVHEGRSWVEKPRILKPLRPEEPLATWHFDLPIPVGRQLGDKTNCGPTAAAMALSAYQGVHEASAVRVIRDVLGEWTWQAFPLRQMRLPGYDAGMTTRHMMEAALERFEPSVGWQPTEHPWLPREAWAVIVLKQAIAERRPLVVLAEAKTLWGIDVAGLHWVVVRGIDNGNVVFNDPADGTVSHVSLERFWQAWRLPDVYRGLPMVTGFEALMPDRSLPLVLVAADNTAADSLLPR